VVRAYDNFKYLSKQGYDISFAEAVETYTPFLADMYGNVDANHSFSKDEKLRLNAIYEKNPGRDPLELFKSVMDYLEILSPATLPDFEKQAAHRKDDPDVMYFNAEHRCFVTKRPVKEEERGLFRGAAVGDEIFDIIIYPAIPNGKKDQSPNRVYLPFLLRELAQKIKGYPNVKGVGGVSWMYGTEIAKRAGFEQTARYPDVLGHLQNRWAYLQLLGKDDFNMDRLFKFYDTGELPIQVMAGWIGREKLLSLIDKEK
jgi:hypothetical protein